MSSVTNALKAANYIERMPLTELAAADSRGLVALTLEGIHRVAAVEREEDHARGVLLDARAKGLAAKVVKTLLT